MSPRDGRLLDAVLCTSALLLTAAAVIYAIGAGYRPGIYVGAFVIAGSSGYLRWVTRRRQGEDP